MIKEHKVINNWMQVRQILSRPLPPFYTKARMPGSLRPGSKDWDMDCGWEKAFVMANNQGWPDGAALIKNLSDKYIASLAHLKYAQQYVYDTEGLAFDVGLLMQGEPEHWIKTENTDEVNKKNGRLYNVVINIGASHSIPSEYIVRRGAAAASIVSLIEYAGFGCSLTATNFAANRKRTCEHRCDLILKQHGEPLDIDRLALATVHPAGVRRIFFRISEMLSSDAMRRYMPFYINGGSYGIPQDLCNLAGVDVYAPALRAVKKRITETPFSCDAKTEAWIKSQLSILGVVND